MIMTQIRAQERRGDPREMRLAAMIEYLRNMVVEGPGRMERFHAIFVNSERTYLADEPMGQGKAAALSLRMRDLFGRALTVGATGIIVAHNHPSGDCRPSKIDVDATRRLAAVALALDIELLDHLIFTESAVYSMRAGGDL